MTIEKAVTVGQKVCDVVTWTDAGGKPRTVALVRADGDGKLQGGYIEQYSYFLGEKQVTGRSDETMPDVSGLGVSMNHPESSSKSHSTEASTQFVLEGPGHCIWRFRSQFHGKGQAQGEDKGHPVAIGLVIDYLIADGRSDIVWAVSYDCSKLKDKEIGWDARGPYFQFDWDGDGKFFPHQGARISGIRWGDRYHFKTVKFAGKDSTWDYTQPNQIPYMMLYKEGALGDVECAVIQTVPWEQKNAGGYWWSSTHWGQTGTGMMESWNCTFQLNAYEGYDGEKMAWGTPYGTVGYSQYQGLDMKTNFSGYPYQGYSVLIVLGRHSDAPGDKMIASLETVQKTKVSASKGKVATQLPAYVGLETQARCATAGWDGVYGQWVVECDESGQAEVNFNTGDGVLLTPTVCFSGFASAKASVSLNGRELRTGEDCFVTADPAGKRLLVTFARSFQGASNLVSVK